MNLKLLSDYEDIVQEAVYKYGEKHPWLKRIVKHKALNFFRRQKRQDDITTVDLEYYPIYNFSWEDLLSEETKCCLDKLSDIEKKIVKSRVIDEDTYTEIGAENNISYKMSSKIFVRACKKLKRCILSFTSKNGSSKVSKSRFVDI